MVSKITTACTPLEEVAKINEIIDEIGGGSDAYANKDLSNLSTTGQNVIDGKANTALSNITTAGQNVVKGIIDARITVVNSLPASPDANTWYGIPE